VEYGGAQELWDALSGQYNIKPLLCLNTGVQMGGWFNISSPHCIILDNAQGSRTGGGFHF